MAECFPIRSSAPREPDRRPRPIPRKVRQAIELLVYGKPDDEDCKPVDLVTAANEVGLRPYVLRRYLDRGNVRAALLRERRAFRAAICGANELALKRVRDNSANGMCVVASVRQLEAMDADDGGRSVHAPTPGIVIKIINQSAPPVDAGNVIDVTPAPKPAPAIDSSYPIFKPPGY